MDTRTKIISAERAAEMAKSGAQIVSGYFDPLTAALAEQLAALKHRGGPLVVLIRSADNAILPARARAELVAALAVADYVCADDSGAPIEAATHLEQEHQRRLRELIAHVHARQDAAPADPHAPRQDR